MRFFCAAMSRLADEMRLGREDAIFCTAMRRLYVLCLALLLAAAARAQTGQAVPQMAHYDTWATNFLASKGVPGMAVAVMQDGRLVYARGFGVADPATNAPVQPTTRFRIASVSKPITAAVAMWLVQQGKLTLDQPAFALLPHLPALPGQTEDARLATITVRQLLEHTGGWNRDATGYDPMFDVVNIARAANPSATEPASCPTVIRYMRGRTLDFAPGTRYAYSNFGYCVLGRVLEAASGKSYEALTKEFLALAGIAHMELGRSLYANRLTNEAGYKEYYGLTCANVFAPTGPAVPCPYGGFYLEAMDAHGGWVASAPDLLRFVRAVDGRTPGDDVLTAASIQTMTARPAYVASNATSWYALGWSVNTNGHWWHTGALQGTRTFLGRMNYKGLSWVVLANTWDHRRNPDIGSVIDNDMWTLAQQVTTWPTHDLFPGTVAAEPDDAVATGATTTVTVAPNPVRGAAAVTVALDAPTTATVTVHDLLGREVARLHDGPMAAGAHRLLVDTSSLMPGVYLVRVAAGETVTTQRLVVTR